jgi:acyl-CoA thioesterase-1
MKAFISYCCLSLLLLVLLPGCKQKGEEPSQSKVTPKEENLPKIVAFGNSLTAGLGLQADESYPAALQRILNAGGYKYRVINAGVSGDTSSGGLRRLDWSLEPGSKIMILELGANDILRGQPVEMIKKNLGTIVEKAQSRGIIVLLVQMEAPTSFGPDYRKEVHEAYPEIAKKYNITLIPFILKPLVSSDRYIQADGTHPTAEGAKIIAENVFHSLEPLLGR